MGSREQTEARVDQFIFAEIDSVPHLEALLLIWNSRPQPWSAENLANRLYIPQEAVGRLLADLMNRGFISKVATQPEGYRYESSSLEQDGLMADVDAAYRREVVRISTMIHAKPSAAVREFARAFRLKKESE